MEKRLRALFAAPCLRAFRPLCFAGLILPVWPAGADPRQAPSSPEGPNKWAIVI
jgi:hypothetical protein